MDNKGSGATTMAEGAALVRTAADQRAAVETKKYAAAKINPEADKFAQNAANPVWVGGFDEKLGITRTSS